MMSFTAGQPLYETLTQNNTAANATLYNTLVNIEHRYLMQKFFGNEGSYSIPTIGNVTLYLTATPNVGDLTATLDVNWAFPTCTTVVTFSDGEIRNALFTTGSTAVI